MTTRRNFLKLAVAAAATPTFLGRAQAQDAAPKSPSKLKLLILGGTAFLGPHVVEQALAKGHEITLFNRGKTNPGLFPDLEKLVGDRNGKLDALKDRSWDAVIDTSGYVPRHVKLSAELLAPRISHYVFISTLSVYPRLDGEDASESTAVGTLEDETVEKVTGVTYGPLKALCEKAAEAAMPGKTTNLRPGLIVGPGDDSDRYTYWPMRVRRGGDVLAPGSPDHTVQYIDVRDLAAFTLRCIENKIFGVMNVVGPAEPERLGAFLETCKTVTKSDARFIWCDSEFLAEHKVMPWGDMPMWIPPAEGAKRCARAANDLARKHGLSFRSSSDTVAATLAWFDAEEKGRPLRAGLKAEREAKVLEAWAARQKK